MAGINKVILIGNLGKDPVINTVGDKKVARFTLGVSETYKDKEGNRVQNTDWVQIVMWRHLANIAEQYLVKGTRVYIEGKLHIRTWDDEKGVKHTLAEVTAEQMQMLDSKSKAATSAEEEEDGLPF